MSRFSTASRKWLSLGGLLAAVAALAAAAGGAFASESGNAPAVSTNAPDPTSAAVVINGPDNTSGTPQAQFVLCFDKQLQTITSGSTAAQALVSNLRLYGYGTKGTEDPQFNDSQHIRLSPTFSIAKPGGGTYGYTADAASNPSNSNCVNVTITSTSGSAPGFDLNGISEVGVSEGAGTGLNSLRSTPATVAMNSSSTEVVSRSGGNSGPKLLAASTSGLAPNQVGYVFSFNLDPNVVDATRFHYYDSSGTPHNGTSASVSGNTVVVTFGGTIVNDVYYTVDDHAVYTQTQENPNRPTGAGSSISSVPTLRSVTPVSGVSGAYDLTYDQCVNDVGGGGSLEAVLEDDTVVGAPPSSVSRPSTDCRIIRVSFGSITNFSNYASKVVKIVDTGGEVQQQSSPNHNSAPGEGDATAPPNMQPGFNNSPNLIGFSLDTANATATYKFDSQGGPLNASAVGAATYFGLLYTDGTTSYDAGSYGSGVTFTGPNQVTVQYNPSQVKNVAGGLIGSSVTGGSECTGGTTTGCDGDEAVLDYQGNDTISPQVSGVGQGGISTTTSTSTTVTTQTTSTTTVRTSTRTTTTNKPSAKCPRGKHRSHGRCVKNKKHKKHKKCPKGKHRKGKKCVKNKK